MVVPLEEQQIILKLEDKLLKSLILVDKPLREQTLVDKQLKGRLPKELQQEDKILVEQLILLVKLLKLNNLQPHLPLQNKLRLLWSKSQKEENVTTS